MSERSNKSTILLLSLIFPVLVACSGGGVDEPSGPSSSDSSEQPSPTASEPQPWEARTPAGARAFVRHYIDTVNEAMVSLDSSEMKALAVGSCKTCANWERFVDKTKKNRGEIFNQDLKISRITPLASPENRPEFYLELRMGKSGYRPKPGSSRTHRPPKDIMLSAQVTRKGGGWKVHTLEGVPVQ